MAKIEFKVRSLWEAHGEIGNQWPTKIVTILGVHDLHLMPSMGDHHFIAVAEDIDSDIEGFGMSWPTHRVVREILDYTATFEDGDRVLFHCKAGLSRSTAIAIGVLIQHGMSVDDAFAAVKEQRPNMFPNRLIASYIDEELGLGFDFEEKIRQFYQVPTDEKRV